MPPAPHIAPPDTAPTALELLQREAAVRRIRRLLLLDTALYRAFNAVPGWPG